MSFERCPECNETNWEESGSVRTFDCGFQGYWSTRHRRCSANGTKRLPKQPAKSAAINDEAARYRLALLDAAQAADGLASDMAASGQDQFASRCRELARQMRRFAGHDADADFQGFGGQRSTTGLVAIVRRMWSR
jgi:hypothetical protein